MDPLDNKVLHIGILGAMQEEIGNTINFLHNTAKTEYGDLTIFSGEIKIDKNPIKKIFFWKSLRSVFFLIKASQI